MTVFSILLISHVMIAIASVSSASMSFFVSSNIKRLQIFMWSTYGLTIVSGVGLFMLVPSTLGRSCAMMVVLTPLAILAHKRLEQKLLQYS